MSELRLLTKTETTLHYTVVDTSGNPVSTATVTATVIGPDGTKYVDTATLAWNAPTSDYQYTIPAATFTPSAGAGYLTIIQVSVGGVAKIYKPIPTVIADDDSV